MVPTLVGFIPMHHAWGGWWHLQVQVHHPVTHFGPTRGCVLALEAMTSRIWGSVAVMPQMQACIF